MKQEIERLKADLALQERANELAATEVPVDALQTQRAADAVAAMRAVAEAREEQREVTALAFLRSDWTAAQDAAEEVRAMPLDSTPLADRIAELNQRLVDLAAPAIATEAARAKAEARVKELEAELAEVAAARGDEWARAESLKAQVERLTAAVQTQVSNLRAAHRPPIRMMVLTGMTVNAADALEVALKEKP